MGKLAKEDKIISAAIKVFSKEGYHKAKMSQIADEAGVAKGTLYCYFDSKKDLFRAIILSRLNKLIYDMKEEVAKEVDFKKKLRKIVEISFYFFSKSKQVSKMYQESTVVIDQDFRGKLLSFKEEEVNLIKNIIDEAKAQGEIRTDLDSIDLANILIGIIGSFNPHFYKSCENTLLNKVDLILDVFLNGIYS